MKKLESSQMPIQESAPLMYRGKPLVRCGNTIYYGSLSDQYVIKMDLQEFSEKNDITLSSKVSIEMIETSPDIESTQKIVKVSEKSGLYSALDIADIWLSRAKAGN